MIDQLTGPAPDSAFTQSLAAEEAEAKAAAAAETAMQAKPKPPPRPPRQRTARLGQRSGDFRYTPVP
jgi:hypothetical protein